MIYRQKKFKSFHKSFQLLENSLNKKLFKSKSTGFFRIANRKYKHKNLVPFIIAIKKTIK